jgi:hypothetical protein
MGCSAAAFTVAVHRSSRCAATPGQRSQRPLSSPPLRSGAECCGVRGQDRAGSSVPRSQPCTHGGPAGTDPQGDSHFGLERGRPASFAPWCAPAPCGPQPSSSTTATRRWRARGAGGALRHGRRGPPVAEGATGGDALPTGIPVAPAPRSPKVAPAAPGGARRARGRTLAEETRRTRRCCAPPRRGCAPPQGAAGRAAGVGGGGGGRGGGRRFPHPQGEHRTP